MFDIDAFDNLPEQIRERRLAEIERAVRRAVWLDAVAEATWGAVALYAPDRERFKDALKALKDFLKEHKLN